MFYNILTTARKKLLPGLAAFKKDFYLAGGTALALQFGHRESEDFDFFTKNGFSTEGLYKKILSVFKEYSVKKIQEEKDTLTVLVNGVKLSFFKYPYPLLDALINEDSLNLASVVDIGGMKCSAIISRSAKKDYVDLFFILRQISLADLLAKSGEKFPDLDTNLITKSIVYFNDVIDEPIRFIPGKEVSWEEIQQFLKKHVSEYFNLP